MIRSLLIDDEPKNIRILSGLLGTYCPEVEILGHAEDAETGISMIRQHQPDLVFLDIEMPHGNAFELLDNIMPVNFEIIFITAFDDYTLKAFRYSALDYLLKPVSIDELKLAVKKASERLQTKNLNLQLSNLVHNIRRQSPVLQKIALPWKDEIDFVALSDIVRFESKGGYTHVYLSDKRKFLSNKTIKEYEELLPADTFFRIHNAHLINLNCVKKYHRGRGGRVEMPDNVFIEVATRRKDEFLAIFGHKG
jgi:two-component system, LytTR family, response regulator